MWTKQRPSETRPWQTRISLQTGTPPFPALLHPHPFRTRRWRSPLTTFRYVSHLGRAFQSTKKLRQRRRRKRYLCNAFLSLKQLLLYDVVLSRCLAPFIYSFIYFIACAVSSFDSFVHL